jgi:membrane fusion protein, heavy metal efflux system
VVGIIESIAVERGDLVKKGQILAILKSQPERAAVALAKARQDAEGEVRAAEAAARFSAQQLLRNEDLFKRNFISHNALDQSRADAEVTRNKLTQARENRRVAGSEVDYSQAQLSQRTITSPFDGVVTERYLAPGERVEEKAILRVAQINPLRVQVIAPISLYGQIKAGDSATIQPELPGAPSVRALVTHVDKVIEPASNTFRTLLRIDNPAYTLPAGLRCNADFSKAAASVANRPLAPVSPAPVAVSPKKEPKAELSSRVSASAKPAAKSPGETVGDMVEQWRKAWAGKQIEQYLALYADNFRPPRQLTREAWVAERQQRLARPEPITLSIEQVHTTSPTPGEVKLTFEQHYKAGDFTETVRKALVWRKQGERWLIVQERTLP